MRELLWEHGIGVNDPVNRAWVDGPCHRGIHTRDYYSRILGRLRTAITGRSGWDARVALMAELEAIQKEHQDDSPC